jgi:hypothetical protein
MLITNALRAAALAAAALVLAAAAARADECEAMTRSVKVLIDEMRAVAGQMGADQLKALRNVQIRHENAINFKPR